LQLELKEFIFWANAFCCLHSELVRDFTCPSFLAKVSFL
jgi:hypothetical protein